MTRFHKIALVVSLCVAVLLGVGAVTLINLTTQVSGTLPAANGGTGNTANGTNGQVLIGDGAGHFTPQDPLITWNTVTILNAASATATHSGGPITLPTRSLYGTFSVVGAGITGSPSGCNVVYSAQNNLGGQNSGTLQTFNFTPANSYQTFSTTPPAAQFTADALNATYACGTYPSAGTISLVFTPASTVGLGWPLPAGTNLLGKAGFDNTTPGTTNGVTQYQPARTTGTVTTSASTVSIGTTGYGVATVSVNGTYAGVTINFEFSDDSGTTWYAETCTRTDASTQENSEALPSNQTRAWDCGVFAATNFRVRSSAFASGTANIGITLSAAAIEPAQTVAISGTVPTNAAQINGNTTTTTDNGTQAIAQVPTTSSAAAVSECDFTSAASTNATNCKASAGNFYAFELYNTTTTVYYFRLYNLAAAPTCSSATGFIRSIPIAPASAAGGVGGVVSNFVYPVNYGTGISFCITGGSSSTDNTNAAIGVFGVIKYK